MHESESEVIQSCLTFCDPMDYSPPVSSIHGNFQARILEWVAISFSKGSSQPRGRTLVSHIAGRLFIIWATRESRSLVAYGWKIANHFFFGSAKRRVPVGQELLGIRAPLEDRRRMVSTLFLGWKCKNPTNEEYWGQFCLPYTPPGSALPEHHFACSPDSFPSRSSPAQVH